MAQGVVVESNRTPEAVTSAVDDIGVARRLLVETTREWGYFRDGVRAKAGLLKGRRVLDIGMGAGPFGIAYVESGAASYTGVDPHVGSDHVRDFRNLKDSSIPPYHAFPYSVREIERLYPNIHLYPALLEDAARDVMRHRPNFATMSSVSEHLRSPDLVFKTIWDVLERDGIIWVDHQNYYSWTGHHDLPRSVAAWDRNNSTQNEVIDWKHLEPTHRAYTDSNFNRIRLEDLRIIVAKYFEIIAWNSTFEAVSRLTPEIRKRWRKYSLAELLTQTVVIVGRRRDVPLDIDFSGRQFFQPSEDYLADKDYLPEDITPFELDNRVYFSKEGEVCSHSNNNFGGWRVFERLKPGDLVVISKYWERYNFTIAEISRPGGGMDARLKLVEAIPEPMKTTNHSDWKIEL